MNGAEIAIRIYRPKQGQLPALVYFHGGAWWLGDLELGDAECRDYAARADCVVISVDYRLAPEHKFPTPFEDCYAATCWVADNAARLGVDTAHLAVAGASAGGNLAAAVALAARDRGGPSLAFQLLEIPATDASLDFPSMEENAEGYLLSRAAMEQGRKLFILDSCFRQPKLTWPAKFAGEGAVRVRDYDDIRTHL